MKNVLSLTCVMLLVAVSLVAAKTPPKALPYSGGKSAPWEHMTGYFEGFEGAFPPTGWTQIITNPTYTWVQDSFSPFEGSYAAYVPWQAGFPQHEVLEFSYTIGAGEDHLNFASMGSIYWSPNATLTVEINGVEVWNFGTAASANWVWEMFDIDLSAYTGQTVEIAFIYSGNDGADQYLDAVGINAGYVPPPPPPNDTCAGAIGIPYGVFSIDGSTDLANNDYSPYDSGTGTSCTGYSAAGADVVYCVHLPVGESFEVVMTTSGWDDSIYLITDCDNPAGSCVAGSDLYPDGSTFTYVAESTGIYYLIVDAYSGGGAFNISGVNGGAPSGAEATTWGAVKASYR